MDKRGWGRPYAVPSSLFIVSLIFHLLVVWQDFGTLACNGYLCDDSFYAFKIARNIAAGVGPTFDGIHLTNGFQPLYVFLLVPIYALSGSNLVLPIQAALSLSALFAALATVLFYFIAKRYVSRIAAGVAAVLWTFSPVVIKQSANGLETSLVTFLFSLSAYYYLTRIRSQAKPRGSQFVVMGMLLGLTILARVDEILFLAALLLDYLCLLRRRRAAAGALRRVFLVILAAVVVLTPWLAYEYAEFGKIEMDSGAATRFISVAYAPFFNIKSGGISSPGFSFYEYQFLHSLDVLKLTPPLQAFYRLLDKTAVAWNADGVARLLGNLVLLLVLGAVLLAFVRSKKFPEEDGRSELNFLLVFSVLLVAAYSFYVFGFFFFIRYYYPVYFVLALYLAIFAEGAVARLGRSRLSWLKASSAGLAALYLIAFFGMSYKQAFKSKPVYCFYGVADWVRNNTEEFEKVAAFQCGAIGYFSGRRVVNLDGKVNPEALAALKSGDLAGYLIKEKVDIVLDRRDVLSLFLGEKAGKPELEAAFLPIMKAGNERIPGWSALRLSRVSLSGSVQYPGMGY